MPTIYLDNSATTPLCEEAVNAMTEAMGCFGNPSSLHGVGQSAHLLLNRARGQVAAALGVKAVKPNELIFTSCGSESDNWAIRAALWQGRHKGKHVITTAIEQVFCSVSAYCAAKEASSPIGEYFLKITSPSRSV